MNKVQAAVLEEAQPRRNNGIGTVLVGRKWGETKREMCPIIICSAT